ncbi:MAG: hypothetical protein WBI62_05690 [Sedimentibacter sp.]
MTDKYFEDFYKSVVVLANPKTVLNAKFAKKEIKKKVIRADQLVKYIKDIYVNSKVTPYSEEVLLEWANSFLILHKEVEKDYTGKYDKYRINNSKSEIAFRYLKDRFKNVIDVKIPFPCCGHQNDFKLAFSKSLKLAGYKIEDSKTNKL